MKLIPWRTNSWNDLTFWQLLRLIIALLVLAIVFIAFLSYLKEDSQKETPNQSSFHTLNVGGVNSVPDKLLLIPQGSPYDHFKRADQIYK